MAYSIPMTLSHGGQPRVIRWSPNQVLHPEQQPTLVRLESDTLQSSAFQTWLRNTAGASRTGTGVDAKAPDSCILLLLPRSVPVDSLRSLLAGSEDIVDFVLGDFASMSDESIIAYLTTEGVLTDTFVDDTVHASGGDKPQAERNPQDLAPYLHPPYRLNDESYAQWFDRLRQDPQKRDD